VGEEFLDLSFSEKMDDVQLAHSSDLKRKINMDTYSIITGKPKGLEYEWFDAVVSTMESCDIIESIIMEEEEDENCLPVRRYASHNRNKDLWATEWGQMIITLKTVAEGSWARRKFQSGKLLDVEEITYETFKLCLHSRTVRLEWVSP
jgi:hypothetical protein